MTRNYSPTPINNRPGLSQLTYRIGDYNSFRQRLLVALTTVLRSRAESSKSAATSALKESPNDAPLSTLTTRDTDDPAIALLDAWAVVADVLTFYQERIANEGFLRTATERRSVLELARTIGYELDPGVAASTYLSFKVEDAPGSPTEVLIPARTQVMSVPEKDELPQIFETIEDFTARLEWNGLQPRSSRPQRVYPHTRQLYIAGTSTQLQPGDLLLLVDDVPERKTYLLLLQTVTPNSSADYTLVQWRDALPAITTPLRRPQLFAFRLQAHLYGYNAPPWKTMPAEVKLAAIEKGGGAIQGGVFRSDSDGLLWTAASQGLPDSDILCLAARNQLLLAGTPDNGLFRSTDNGQSWEAANEGITSMNVLALHISAKGGVFNEAIFAGTPNGGVFRSKDQGKNWVSINQGTVRSRQINDEEWEAVNTSLPNTMVRSITSYTSDSNLGTGTIYSEGVVVQGENTAFTSQLIEGDEISAIGQTRTVISVNSDTSLTIDQPFFIASLPRETAFRAQITIRYGAITTTDFRTFSTRIGTISSIDNIVQGEGTEFLQILADVQALPDLNITSREIVITANGQTRNVTHVISNTRLIIENPFTRNNLDYGTSFQLTEPVTGHYIFVGTDEGVYRSQDLGENWLPKDLKDHVICAICHTNNSNIFAATSAGVFHSANDGESWNENNLPADREAFSLTNFDSFVFAGTSLGVFRSSDSGATWSEINTVQTTTNGSINVDSSGLALPVRSLATYERGGTRYLFAATDDGIFVSTNSGGPAENVTWQLISQALATQSAIALAVDDIDATLKTLFAGTEFGGFLPAEIEPETSTVASSATAASQEHEWPDFTIQDPRQVDLNTLYPQILLDSWTVLVDDREPGDPEQQAEHRYAVRQVSAIADVDRQDFGLSGKISRLEFEVSVDPTRFGLRSARLLGQSTELPLALEPLTVSDRQREIFADPIKGKTVYLQTFVTGLQTDQVVMVSGKHMRMQLSDVGGVLRSRHDWQPLNAGLNNLTINALTLRESLHETYFIATNDGLYRRTSATDIWEPVAPLRFKAVHSLFLEPDFLLIGADLDLYRTDSTGQNLAKVELPVEATILTFCAYQVPEGDSIDVSNISGITVRTSATNISVGTVVTANNQTRVVIEQDSATAETPNFLIDRTFELAISTPATFERSGRVWLAGTDRGILRSSDEGKTWAYLKNLQDRQINSLISRIQNGVVEIFAGTDKGLYFSNTSGQSWERLDDFWNLSNPLEVNALVKQDTATDIWIGTTTGVYQLGAGQTVAPQRLLGLRDRTIYSLHFQSNILYAGTDQGIYRFVVEEDVEAEQWESLDAGLTPSMGRVLLAYNHQLLVGTENGLFSTRSDGQRLDPVDWSRSNTGIVNSQVLCLASSDDATTVLAGTTAGLYRSMSCGRTWQPFDDDLDQASAPGKLKIQTVLNSKEKGWFVGTPEGVFVYASMPDQPDVYRWQPVGKETLPYPDVRAIARRDRWLLAGTIVGGLFKLDLNAFAPSTLAGAASNQRWQPTGLNNTSVQAIAFSGPIWYVGTLKDGLFRSRNGGTTWQSITDRRTVSGTLVSDGNQATWSGFTSLDSLQAGDQITTGGQTRTILERQPQGQAIAILTLDNPFRPNLIEPSAFTVSTGLTNLEITALDTEPNSQAIFAGTNGSGVYHSNDGGDRWQQLNTNLSDLTIRCLLCEATNIVWVGTATRVFRSINRGELWSEASLNLHNTDVRSLLLLNRANGSTSNLLAGGIGILKSEDGLTTKPVQRHDITQVITSPQPVPPSEPVTSQLRPPSQLRIDPISPLQPNYRWLLRDKDNTIGLIETTPEQLFPLLPAAEDDALVSEQGRILHPPTDQQQPILTLQAPITYSYDPATVEIAANVVKATHGETTLEILGSGDGNSANQRFELKKLPLTFVTAANARGSESTLEVWVDGVLWESATSLYSLNPQEQAYIVRIEDDETTAVTFGDGQRGARPPSGQENITARYRRGIGAEGNIAAERLSILKTRPQGIDKVINALPATGGTDRESLAAARINAPPTARTLGRIVSLQDFQAFTLGFVGIGKAQAVPLWDGSTQVVHITVAGSAGAAVPEMSALYQALVSAIAQARDPMQQVVVTSYEQLFFNLEAKVLLDQRYLVELVQPQLMDLLMQTFAFERRRFSQPVTSAEVIATLQSIEGVLAVDLDALYRVDRSRALNSTLNAQPARYNLDTETIEPAQLLSLNPVGVQLTFVATL